MEQALQEALDVTESFLEGTGLRLSPTKSELMLYRPARQGVRGLVPLEQIPIDVYTRDGQKIPRVNSINILGLLLDARGCNVKTIAYLTAKTENIRRLIMRVSNKKGGLGEDNQLRAHHAFLMSHIKYVVSALQWTKTERDKLDTLMRKSVKEVLGIPVTASTDRLMQLGVHNTTLELIEAQQAAQITRLSGSSAVGASWMRRACGRVTVTVRRFSWTRAPEGPTSSVPSLETFTHSIMRAGEQLVPGRF